MLRDDETAAWLGIGGLQHQLECFWLLCGATDVRVCICICIAPFAEVRGAWGYKDWCRAWVSGHGGWPSRRLHRREKPAPKCSLEAGERFACAVVA